MKLRNIINKIITENLDNDEIFNLHRLVDSGDIENIKLALEIGNANDYDIENYIVNVYQPLINFANLEAIQISDGTLLQQIQEVLNLTELNVSFKRLKQLPENFNLLNNLQRFECGDNLLKSLNVSDLVRLQILFCHYNQLESLNIYGNERLENLSCTRNQLKTLDISNNPNLEYLYCNYNELTSLNVEFNNKLNILYCDNNKLQSLDVSNLKDLTTLACEKNDLEYLDVSANINLQELSCSGNRILNLHVNKNGKLNERNIYKDPHTKINWI